MAKSSFNLKSPPKGLITSLNFDHHGRLYVSSFEGEIFMYTNLPDSTCPFLVKNLPESILDTCLQSSDGIDSDILIGGVLGTVYQFNTYTQKLLTCPFKHKSGVQCLERNEDFNVILTGSWDNTGWIIPENSNGVGADARKITLNGKVQAMDSSGNYLIYALSTGQNVVYDLRRTEIPIRTEATSFKTSLVTCLRAIPQGKGFVQGSIEGKASVETFSGETKYTFKCHRTPLVDDVDFAGPINDLCFIDEKRFFTAGSNVDRRVCLWDYTKQKRLRQYSNLPMGVSCLKYSPKLRLLALATCDDSFKNSVSISNPKFPDRASCLTVIPINY
ncbi:DEBR0S5_04016g1_1 [Brettanomyces bruxellensis]|uniref:DEBR0S5_04016g1_1 n=1 Tax=Dekkera bruxellensis TaxID=5007 RepID=A0A7D9H6B1_DEKBR|nr:DEBR0S5_04016g1_1 [Brettanomyces bruxellensis]